MSSALRSVVVFAFVSAFAVLAVPGCSQQGEGERCDSAKNGDLDCDAGLSCIRMSELIEGLSDRCCPAEGSETDKRCTRGVPTATTGGSGGSSSGGTGSGGTSSGGSSSGGTGATGAEAGAGGEVSTAGGGGEVSTAGAGGAG